LQIAVPRWSPDGKAIAFIGGLMSDQGATGGDVWIVSTTGAGGEGGEPRDLTQGRPTSPAWIEWDGNEHLFVSELAGGNSQLIRYHLQGDRTSAGGQINFGSPIFSIPGSVGDGRLEMSLSSTADRSLFVFRASTFDHAEEIYAAKPATVMSSGLEGVIQLSHWNDGVEPAWGKSVSLSWKSDAFRVQGWLMLPKDYDPSKKYPLIVEVHGGPASAEGSHWGGGGGLSAAAFSALGYFVLQPNPRGSFGQGEEFTQANRKDFGYGDLRDILAGVDTVEANDRVELRRIHDHVCGDPNAEVQGGGGGRGDLGLAELLRGKLDRPVDDAVFWGLGLRRSGGVREEFGDQLYQAGADTYAGCGGGPGRRVPGAAVLRVLARAAGPACADATGGLPQRRAWVCGSRARAGRDGAGRGVVCALFAAGLESARPLLAIAERRRLCREGREWLQAGFCGGPAGPDTLFIGVLRASFADRLHGRAYRGEPVI
jgi:hypothetical protein